MEFSETEKQEIMGLKKAYPDERSLILPLLWMIQKREGWVPEEAVNLIASELHVPPIWVEEPRTWYSMFNKQKMGKYVLEVCQNASCAMLGSEEIIEYISRKLNIQVGETTPDGLFTLQVTECLGSCGTGPMMQVGENYYELLTPEKVDTILENLRTGKEIEQKPQQFPEYK